MDFNLSFDSDLAQTLSCESWRSPLSAISVSHTPQVSAIVIIHFAVEEQSIICMYRQPSAKADFYNLKLPLSHTDFSKEIVIMGDFNVNRIDKKDRKNLKLVTDHYNLTQLINDPTRKTTHSQTKIDLIFSNKPDRITKTYNLLTSLLDHNAIFFSRKLTKLRVSSSLSDPSKSNSHNIIPKNLEQDLAVALNSLDWTEVLSRNSIENCCDDFHRSIKEVMTPFIRRGCHQKKDIPCHG